jgi:hexulose-6-phosphate isomerase
MPQSFAASQDSGMLAFVPWVFYHVGIDSPLLSFLKKTTKGRLMSTRLTRRNFLATSAAVGAGLAFAGRLNAAPFKTTLHKALLGNPDEATLKTWKAAGFEGVEWLNWSVTPKDAEATRKMVESQGMKIHSVLFGWGSVNGGETAMAKSIAEMETSLRAAQGYGAEAVLIVPCKIGGMPMPEAWEFDIRFDEKTGHLKQVVAGDNSKYQKYIEAHDHSVDATREAVRKLIPVAEKTGVLIALENVWNNLWVKPDFAANFIGSFDNPWVRAYYDIGNHVKYAPSQDWIRALGKLIVKCHVKDFKLKPDGHGGDFCNIRDGSVDWPAVRTALDEIGYNGWLSIEGGDLSPEEHGKRLDLILAGK